MVVTFKKGRGRQGGGKGTIWMGHVGEEERQGVQEKCIRGLYGKHTKKFYMDNFMLYKNCVGAPRWHSR